MTIFLSAFMLGLAVVATPGAVTMQAVRNGLDRGFRAALLLQIGALVGLTLWSSVGLMGAAMITENIISQLILSVMGMVLLLWLMAQAIKEAVHGKPLETPSSRAHGDFALGAALSLANPLPVAFWLSMSSSMMSAPTPTGLVMFFAGLMSSAVLWSVCLAGITAWG